MKKLKIAFLWHQHQPYYKIENEFILPWVLLHGTKDYYDIPEVLYEFPNIKQTFNFAPSLSLQIDEYISTKTEDRIQKLTKIEANSLNDFDKREILSLFFHANFEKMISPYPRYLELYNNSRDSEFALIHFSENDWLDLQVWYNLVWFGYFSSQTGLPRRLLAKGKDFTEIEKRSLQNQQNEILSKINFQYRKLKELGQIELSCSPMFHPILPLLINSESAHESRQGQKLPDPLFVYPEDAELQLKRGMDYFKSVFGEMPKGVWPSEGSVSDDAINMLINNGINWIATDEQILHNSIKYDGYLPTEKFFPRVFESKYGKISILFRDHFLSDRIGFEYSKWNEKDASADFIYHLRNIKNEIIKNHGEEALESACVSVILDGENCWEYYRGNGIPFLRELFAKLSLNDEFETVTCSEAINVDVPSQIKPLNHIYAGSWINANFDIWIGHEEDIKAWNLLSNARKAIDKYKTIVGEEKYQRALNHLFISEGSDWFWWYGPEHSTKNKPDFDRIFRYYIKQAYLEIGIDVPADVDMPIDRQFDITIDNLPKSKLDNFVDLNFLMKNSDMGFIKLIPEMSAMHQIGDFLDCLYYGNDGKYIYLVIKYRTNLLNDFEIKVYIHESNKEFYVSKDNIRGNIAGVMLESNPNSLVAGLPFSDYQNLDEISINIDSRNKNSYLKYPSQGSYKIKLFK